MLLLREGIRHDHQQTSDDAEIPEEKVEIKDETVSEGLRDDNGKEPSDSEFCVFA